MMQSQVAPVMTPARPLRRASETLTGSEIAWLQRLIRDEGERAVVRMTGLSRNTIARACAGLGLYPGSLALLRTARETSSPR